MIAARLAWRNLGLHKAKSALIASIMGIGIFLLFVGNSMIDTTISGLRSMFIEGFTGDLMVTGPTDFPVTVLGETAGSEEVLPHIAKISQYQTFLSGRKDVRATLPMLSGKVSFGMGETELGSGICFGVDSEAYRTFFSRNVSIVEGSWPEEGSHGWVLLSERMRTMLQQQSGTLLGPGSTIIMTALAEGAGTVIREVKVQGIVRFNQSNEQLAGVSLTDADVLRDLLGFASLRDGPPVLTGREAAFVQSFDPDTLFESLFAEQDQQKAHASDQTAAGSAGENLAVSSLPAAEPAWQFLLIRTVPGANTKSLQKELAKVAAGIGDGDRVQDWVQGAGKVARTAQTIRIVFDALVAVVAVVVVAIMMNVLVISINERLYEIGTLRAIGAKRRVVRRMILLETTFLAVLAGAAGLLAGLILLLVLGKVGVRAPSLFFEALFGGRELRPVVTVGAAMRAFAWILVMSLGASLYPVLLALRIEPVVAMRGE